MFSLLALSILWSLHSEVSTIPVPPMRDLSGREMGMVTTYCGRTAPAQNFKVNGEAAAVGQFPWAAKVLSSVDVFEYYPGRPTGRPSSKTITCSGVLISPRHVITSAICILDRQVTYDTAGDSVERPLQAVPPEQIKVQLGGVNEYNMREEYVIRTYAIGRGSRNNFAFLEFVQPVPRVDFVVGAIRPICMTNEPYQFPNLFQQTFTIAGFAGGELKYRGRLRRNGQCEQEMQNNHDFFPVCYQVDSPWPSRITQDGDAGSGVFRYNVGHDRAYLDGIHITAGRIRPRWMKGVGVAMYPDQDDSPLEWADILFNMRYTTLYH